MSIRIGTFLAYFIPPYMIETDTTLMQTMMSNFYYLYLTIAILSSFGVLLSMFGKYILNPKIINILFIFFI